MFQDPVYFIDESGEIAVALIPFLPYIPVAITAAKFAAAGAAAWLAGSWLGDASSRKSGKEKASDLPSWARGEKPLPGEKPRETADRLSEKKWGPNFDKGAVTDHNKIKKYFERQPKCK